MSKAIVQELVNFLPQISFGCIDNSCIKKYLVTNDNVPSCELSEEEFLKYIFKSTEETLDILYDNYCLEIDPFQMDTFKLTYDLCVEDIEIPNINKIFNTLRCCEDMIGLVSLLNVVMNIYDNPTIERINTNDITSQAILNILFDLNVKGMEQGRINIFELDYLN